MPPMSYGTPLDEGRLSEWEARRRICEIGRWLWQRQYVEANSGNISYRLDNGNILATPTMISKGFMEPDDLVVLDAQGGKLEGRRERTSEILVHLQVYRHRPDVRAVVHCHAPHATAFAVSGGNLPKCVHPELEVYLGEVPITPYETPGTQKVADTLLPFLKDFNVFLLASHGVVAAGSGLIDAYWKAEIIESYCRLIILARTLGEPTRLNREQMAELLQLKKNLGIPDRRIDDPRGAVCDEPVKPREKPEADVDPELARRVGEMVMRRLRDSAVPKSDKNE